MDEWVQFVAQTGFDGWEEASWELDLRRCDDDRGAEAYARERADLARRHGLEVFTIAVHLQGQALGDEPSAKTLNFCNPKGEAREAYRKWRKKNEPPRTDPYFVPDEVGRLVHQEARRDLLACVRLARDYLDAMDRAGYRDAVGFNLDGSHMEWQNVSVVQFIREFGDRIHCAHVKGVWVAREHCRGGLLGGHRDMGYWTNGWNFVTAG